MYARVQKSFYRAFIHAVFFSLLPTALSVLRPLFQRQEEEEKTKTEQPRPAILNDGNKKFVFFYLVFGNSKLYY